jgi:hypothetical protein
VRKAARINGAVIFQTRRHLSNSVEEVVVGINLVAEEQDKTQIVLLAAFSDGVEDLPALLALRSKAGTEREGEGYCLASLRKGKSGYGANAGFGGCVSKPNE